MELGTIVQVAMAMILMGILTTVKLGFNEVIKGLESIDRGLRNPDAP